MTDHPRIWLQPECCADPDGGREWCQSSVWSAHLGCDGTGTEYVRADLQSGWEDGFRAGCERAATVADVHAYRWRSDDVGGDDVDDLHYGHRSSAVQIAKMIRALPVSAATEANWPDDAAVERALDRWLELQAYALADRMKAALRAARGQG